MTAVHVKVRKQTST